MTDLLKATALALIFTSATAAYAQEATTEAPAEGATETTQTEAPAAEAVEGETAEGAEAPAEGEAEPVTAADLQPGEPYFKETFGDWQLRCINAPDQEDPCQLYQLLKDSEGNNVAEISMFPLPEGAQATAGATIVAPLETLLPAALTLSVDGGENRVYPFAFCNAGGCVARVGFTAAEVDQFKRGAEGKITLVNAAFPDRPVDLKLSLTGFTAGYDSTPEMQNP